MSACYLRQYASNPPCLPLTKTALGGYSRSCRRRSQRRQKPQEQRGSRPSESICSLSCPNSRNVAVRQKKNRDQLPGINVKGSRDPSKFVTGAQGGHTAQKTDRQFRPHSYQILAFIHATACHPKRDIEPIQDQRLLWGNFAARVNDLLGTRCCLPFPRPSAAMRPWHHALARVSRQQGLVHSRRRTFECRLVIVRSNAR